MVSSRTTSSCSRDQFRALRSVSSPFANLLWFTHPAGISRRFHSSSSIHHPSSECVPSTISVVPFRTPILMRSHLARLLPNLRRESSVPWNTQGPVVDASGFLGLSLMALYGTFAMNPICCRCIILYLNLESVRRLKESTPISEFEITSTRVSARQRLNPVASLVVSPFTARVSILPGWRNSGTILATK